MCGGICRKVWDTINSKILMMLHCNIETNLLTPSRKDSKVPTGTHNREEKMPADHDGNWGSRTPKEDVSRTFLRAKRCNSSLYQEQPMSSTVLCVVRTVHIEFMDDFLMWPDMHTHKGKRQTEKQAAAITSYKYREMFEKKRLAKDAEEKEVQKQT
jgi:hypothetical protein